MVRGARRTVGATVVGVALVLGVAACGGGGSDSATTTSRPEPAQDVLDACDQASAMQAVLDTEDDPATGRMSDLLPAIQAVGASSNDDVLDELIDVRLAEWGGVTGEGDARAASIKEGERIFRAYADRCKELGAATEPVSHQRQTLAKVCLTPLPLLGYDAPEPELQALAKDILQIRADVPGAEDQDLFGIAERLVRVFNSRGDGLRPVDTVLGKTYDPNEMVYARRDLAAICARRVAISETD